jgi:threonine-phosphate decarboxylase
VKWPAHGSNPHYLFEALKQEIPEETIDFSANINPLGPPPVLKENWHSLLSTINDYPDPNGNQLKRKIARLEDLSERQILIGNGGAAIISLIGRMLAGKRAVIVQPAFSEYEEACRVNECTVEYHHLEPDDWEWSNEGLASKLERADALFLCNPNNPTGVYYPKSVVHDLLQLCQQNNCLLIVDEAFYDFVLQYESLVEYINDFKNLLIIRSMTKMYSIPGLRLGYALCDPIMIEKLAFYQPQWSINALALKAGEWCFESDFYQKETLEFVAIEKKRLCDFYQRSSFKLSPSATNFYLLRDPEIDDQLPFFRFLLDHGIIPRHTMNFPGIEGKWLRFAVKTPKANDRLMEVVAQWRRNRRSFL